MTMPVCVSCSCSELREPLAKWELESVTETREAIVAEREHGGAFVSLDDFCMRIDPKKAGKRVLEALIRDYFYPILRGQLIAEGASQASEMPGANTLLINHASEDELAALELPPGVRLEMAGELGVKIVICEMSMDLMGFKREEMIDYEHKTYGGVAGFLEEASNSKVQLFI